VKFNEDRVQEAIAATMAAIEPDCSKTWPACARGPLICDCRLRAVRAVNAMRPVFEPAEGYPGVPVPGIVLVYSREAGVCWQVTAVQVGLTHPESISRRKGALLLADVIVRPVEGVYPPASPDGVLTGDGVLAWSNQGWTLDRRVIPVPHAWTVLHREWMRQEARLKPAMDRFGNGGSREVARSSARGDVIGPAHAKIQDMTSGDALDYPTRKALTELLAGIWDAGEKWGREHAT
jgi:hypothetical protein